MASNFLKKKAEEQAKKVEKQYGSTSDLEKKTKENPSTKSGGGETRSKGSPLLRKKAEEQAKRVENEFGTQKGIASKASSFVTNKVDYKKDSTANITTDPISYIQNNYGIYGDSKYGKGNIDLTNRPVYLNDDGTVSTVDSISINDDGKEILIPTIVWGEDGNAVRLSESEAIEYYHKTGEYLGKFDTVLDANLYAELIHRGQAKMYPSPKATDLHAKLLAEHNKPDESLKGASGDTPFLDSVGYTGEKLVRGAVDAFEDAGDFLVGIVPALGWGITSGFGLWENDVSNWFESGYNTLHNDDLVNYWGAAEERWEDAPDWLKEWGWLPENIGGLIPSMAAMYFSGGATAATGAGSTGAKMLGDTSKAFMGDVVFGAGAGGSATETAIEKGANPLTSTLYGVGSGALEVGTEKLFGGLAGTGWGKSFVEFSSKKPILNFTLGRLGEGAEEMIVTGVDPLLQRVTGVDANADWATWNDYIESGAHGVILSTVMGGITSRTNRSNRQKYITDLNNSAEILNNLTDEGVPKFEPLPMDATEEEIRQRQMEIQAVAFSYDYFVRQNAEMEKTAEMGKTAETGAMDSLEQAAMDVVAKRNAETNETAPIPVVSATDVVVPSQEETTPKTDNRPLSVRVEEKSINGGTVSTEEAKALSGYGEHGVKLLTDVVNNATDKSFSEVKSAMHSAYMDGTAYKDVVPFKGLEREAYFAGAKDRVLQDTAEKKHANNLVINKESGFSTENLPSDVTERQATTIDLMSKALGVKSYMTEGLKGNAELDKKTGEVPIDITFEREIGRGKNKQKVSVVFHAAHEMALHRVVEASPDEGRAFVYALYEHLEPTVSSLADQKRYEYAKQGVSLSLADAMEEVSANNILYLYKNNEKKFHRAIDRIINGTDTKAKQGLRKYIDTLNKIIRKILDFLSGKSAQERAAIQAELNEVIKLRDMFESAFAKAVENVKAQTETKADTKAETESAEKPFSLKDSEKTDTKSSKNLEIKINEEYNGRKDHSLKSEQYTDSEYRDFGWARENEILNAKQNEEYRSKFADATVGGTKFPKSKWGEYIIPVSDSTFDGVNNTLVFAKGTIDNPIITSVIEIFVFDETNLDRIRRRIYECERRGIQQKTGELFIRHNAFDFKFRPNKPRVSSKSIGNSSDNGYGKRSSGETSSTEKGTKVSYSLKGIDGHNDGVESAIYINDGHKKDGSVVDFANAILDGVKKGETRTHKSLTRKWVGIAKDGQVIGRVRLGEPIILRKGTQEYKDSLIEGTEYDIKDGQTKYYYPVEEKMDFRDDPRPILRHGNYGRYQTLKGTDINKLSTEEQKVVNELGKGAEAVTNKNGEMLIATNKNKSTIMYSLKTYKEGGKEKLEKALRENGHTEAEIQQTLSYVDDAADYLTILAAGYAKTHNYKALSDHLIADVITNVKTGKQVLSSIVNNGDYPVNIDLALICKKRVAYMNLMNRLIDDGIFDKVNYGGEAIAKVNALLREDGFETACLGCFVESRRLQFQTWAETIVSEWNAEVDKRKSNAGNFNFADGSAKLTDAEMDALTEELKNAGKKNAQGNLNLGQGSVQTKMGRLLDKVPSLQKHLTVADLLKPEGLTALRAYDSNLFSIVKSRYGAASPKIVQDFNPYASEIAMLTFSSVKNITSNAVKGATAYKNKVINEMGGKPVKQKGETTNAFNERKAEFNTKVEDEAMRRYLYDIGGARIQSFSDFMIENVFDYIQIFADLSAKRLPLHGYTKEIIALRLFGMTGAKWNGSWIAHVDRAMGKEYAGLLPASEAKDGSAILVHTKDGDYAIGFDDYARYKATNKKTFIQSIGMKDMVALQFDPRYSSYVGSITIGVSDKQILAMLDSPLFRFVIPYHSSGMLPQFAKLVGVDLYNDYTDYQNTTVKQWYDAEGNLCEPIKDGKGETIKVDTSYNFNAEVQKTGDAKKAADNYLKWCKEKHPVYVKGKRVGYVTFTPKFSDSPYGTDFTKHENYYKLLEDFNVYDNITEESAVQGAVTMTFPSEANRLTASEMESYKERLRETGIFSEKEIEKYSAIADKTFKELIAEEVKGRAEYQKAQSPKWEKTVKGVEEMLLKDHKRTAYSLKGSINTQDFVNTIKDAQKGKKEAIDKLSKYAEEGAISTEIYNDLIKKYGAIETGENPYREVSVPKKTADDKKVSMTVRTVLEAEATPDTLVPTIEKMVEDGVFSYDVYTDKEAINNAENYIKEYGWEESLLDWFDAVNKGEVSKDLTTTGWALYNNAANKAATAETEEARKEATQTSIRILDAMIQHQRSAAQALQATRILKKMSPEAQLYSIQKDVNRLQQQIDEKHGNKNKGVNVKDLEGAVAGARNKASTEMANVYKNGKVRRKGNKVEIEGNMAGEPFAFEYAQKVGENLAKSLEAKRNTTSKEQTFLQQITAQLKRFAKEKLPSDSKGKSLTAVEMLRDYIQNKDFYNEAWETAQQELRGKYADDEMLSEFINSGIGVDANINPRNAIFMRALVQSAAASKETKSNIVRQSALGVTKISENIAEKLITETKAEGEIAQTIRDATASYVHNVLVEAETKAEKPFEADKFITSAIKGAMHDIGIKLSEVVASGDVTKAKQAIIDKLITKYAFGITEATNTADIVSQQFDAMSKNYAEKKLEGMFKKRDRKTKTVSEQLQLLGNLGAFDMGSKFNSLAAQRIFKTDTDLHIDEALAEKFLTAETEEARLDAEIEIYRDIGRQLPSTFMDKWNAWRYLAMLGNLRTHGRNIFGNAFFAPVVATKNLVATAIESAVAPAVRLSGREMLRGKALVWGSKTDRALLKAAWDDYANVADMVSNGGKYNDSAMANKHIEEGRRIFKFKPLEWARKGNSKALETEDVWFSHPHYAYALAQYCKANNITSEQIKNGKAIAPAREYAIKEAQKATYKDTNAFSQFVSSLGRTHTKKNVITKGASAVIEGVLPFRKTPANILVRGVEYSPLGLVKGLTSDLYKVSKGELNAYEAIDNISAGLTGTGLLALGIWLAAEGLIRGHGEDEEKEKAFNEMMGHQAYSLELPNGQSITLDWLAPEALPFFVGVNIWGQTKGTNEKTNMASILNSLTNITEPMLDMSCLQGLNDLIEGVGYASSNGTSGLMAVLSSSVTSYLMQGLPTIFGQAERTGEEERQTTYTDKNSFLTGDMQYLLGKASAKIPFWDYNQIPYIDAWGRKEASGTALKRGFNNFLNPAYTSQIETSDMEKELLRVYEQTGDASVFPTRADKYFMVDGVRKDLTAEEYVRYATLKGEKSYQMVTELVESKGYQNLTDEERVKAIRDVYDYANQKAKQAISNYNPDRWVSTADDFGSNAENYIAFRTEVSDYTNEHDGNISKEKYVDLIFDYAEDDSEAWAMYFNKYDSKTAIEAEKYGIDAELYMTAVVDMDAIKADYGANGKAINGSRKAKIVRYLNSVCSSYKEYLFLLGTEYSSVKDDADYISYFGK